VKSTFWMTAQETEDHLKSIAVLMIETKSGDTTNIDRVDGECTTETEWEQIVARVRFLNAKPCWKR
jgi:hypothetical protein